VNNFFAGETVWKGLTTGLFSIMGRDRNIFFFFRFKLDWFRVFIQKVKKRLLTGIFQNCESSVDQASDHPATSPKSEVQFP
jgi:hypothetical protein